MKKNLFLFKLFFNSAFDTIALPINAIYNYDSFYAMALFKQIHFIFFILISSLGALFGQLINIYFGIILSKNNKKIKFSNYINNALYITFIFFIFFDKISGIALFIISGTTKLDTKKYTIALFIGDILFYTIKYNKVILAIE